MYEHSKKSQNLAARLQRFMHEHIYPNEEAYAYQLKTAENRFAPLPLMDELKLKAKKAGLWNLFVPQEHAEHCDHGGLAFFDYAPLAEIMGRVIWCPEVFNCNAPDTGNMEVFMNYATEAQQRRWLDPLLGGDPVLLRHDRASGCLQRRYQCRAADRKRRQRVGSQWP